MTRFLTCIPPLLAASLVALPRPVETAEDLRFENDIRPLFETHCHGCHSTGKRKAGLDLRQRRLLVRGGDSGPAIVPGNSQGSLLLEKVAAGEMPPGKRRKLSSREVDLIRRWIDGGAKTAREEKPLVAPEDFVTAKDRRFWSFRPLRRPDVPDVRTDRVRNPVDAFVLARLAPRGLDFSPDASRRALLRRAYFDLIGLPPPPDALDRFLSSNDPNAFERLIDELLASPQYGERWGRHWLDVAGYADSEGYSDADRVRPYAWKYRDYVIDSFNADKGYDVFLKEQLAGDEIAQYPGSGLTPRTVELLTATGYLRMAADGTSDANDKVARTQVVADTLRIFTSGVLGLTVGCAQCHDHRYDPISQRDYYRLRAIFDPALDTTAWKAPGARRVSLYSEADRKKAAEVDALVGAKRAERNARQAEYVRDAVAKVIERIPAEDRDAVRKAHATPAGKRSEAQRKVLAKYPSLNVSGGNLYQYNQKAADHIKSLDAEIAGISAQRPVEDFVRALNEVPGKLPPSRLLLRGDPDQPGDEVRPGVLSVLAPPGEEPDLPPAVGADAMTTSGRRSSLARWLTAADHPLTARVFVNRIWLHHFGRGLVPTPGDFGTQGEAPTHAELLDWLATELVRSGWSAKRLHRIIMTSTVYRQSSLPRAAAEPIDPDDVYYWRKPLVRLEGEVIRDSVLAVSGVLNREQGGAPVPVKEDADGRIIVGVDKKGSSNRPGTEVPIGGVAWRRTVYVQVRRSRPLSFTKAFDVPVMETNCTRRSVSIVAPQALTLLNGQFARRQAEFFAARLSREAKDRDERIRLAFRLAFARSPTATELEDSRDFLREQTAFFPEDGGRKALTNLCHVLLNTSEFITVE